MSNRPISNKSNSNNILLVEKMHSVGISEEKLETLGGSHFMSGADPYEKCLYFLLGNPFSYNYVPRDVFYF